MGLSVVSELAFDGAMKNDLITDVEEDVLLFPELEVDVQIFRQRVNQHRSPMCLWALDKRTVPFSLTGKASVPLQTLHSNLYLDGSST
jgi:hypothetical protein